jgi:hypothetical protein
MMKPMLLARFAKVAPLIAGLLALAPAARGETNSPLPKGYTSDEQAPAAQQPAAPAQPAAQTEAEPAPAPSNTAPAQNGDEYGDTDPSALSDFKEPLAPHGVWVEDPTYGTVWVPNSTEVGADFAPYQTSGHWATDDGGDWLWVSDYDWGYIPFHYGRWIWIGGRGWSWIPGRVYAPAWVVWRTGEYGYIGWAPYPPAWYWSGGIAVAFWAVPPAPFIFCPTGHLFAPHVATYVIHDRAGIQNAASHTQPYKPAQAHAGASASPGGSKAPGGAHSFRPASPSFKDAGVSASTATKARADARAVAMSHPSTTPRPSGARASVSSSAAGAQHASWASRHGISRSEGTAMLHESRQSQPMFRTPDGRSFGHSSSSTPYASHSAPTFHSAAPSYRAPSYSSPSPSYRPPAPTYHGGGSVSGWSAPSHRAAPPAYHPSASPSHFGGGGGYGGGYHPSAPSYHPSTTHSTPSFHSGGGFHGGGGGGRHR